MSASLPTYDTIVHVIVGHELSTYYAALLPRRGPHIASHSVCPSVCPSVPLLFLFTFFTVEPSYERTSKIEKLMFSLMG